MGKNRAFLLAVLAAITAAVWVSDPGDPTAHAADADSTAQIQALLDNPVNGTVRLPSGVFTVRPTLRLNQAATIIGSDTTLRVAANSGNYYAMLTADTAARDLSGLKIMGVTFDQNAANNPLDASTLVNGFPRFALFFYVGSGIEITGNAFVNSDNLNTVVAGKRVTNSIIQGNRFTTVDPGKHDHSSVYLHSTDMSVRDNVFRGENVYGAAVDTHGERIEIANNSVAGYYRAANIVSSNTVLKDNTVVNAVNVVDLWSLEPYGPLHDVTIANNVFYPDVDRWLSYLKLRVPAQYTTPVIYDYESNMPFDRINISYAGPIDQRYYTDAGLRGLLGAPVSLELDAPGAVRYRIYQRGRLYWSAQTGVHEVHGAILGKYLWLGGPGKLGAPRTDETTTPDGVGRYNHFAGSTAIGEASVYWTPQTGANAIWGAIHGLWSRLGWELGPLGYPITDELPTPDGVGRFNHFNKASSIYWTPGTGSHEIYGAIRQRWAALGWERSYLGYPTTGEFGVPGGRSNRLARGFIDWNSRTGWTFDQPY